MRMNLMLPLAALLAAAALVALWSSPGLSGQGSAARPAADPSPAANPTSNAPAKPVSDGKWAKDWASAQAQAEKTHGIIMVDFYADWCGWCKELDRQVYPLPQVQQAMKCFIPIKLNADTDGQMMSATYNVRGLPTILFVTADGKEVDRIGGFERPPDFLKDLNRIAREQPQS